MGDIATLHLLKLGVGNCIQKLKYRQHIFGDYFSDHYWLGYWILAGTCKNITDF
jgi:hypothetical protein